MNIDELKELIREKIGWVNFAKIIRNEIDDDSCREFLDKTGLAISYEDSYRDIFTPSCYSYVFNIDGRTYEATGYYDSWEGYGLELSDASDFYEVELVKKVIEVWQPIEEKTDGN